MRRLLKISSLRHLMQQFPRQNYSVYRSIYAINDFFISKSCTTSRLRQQFSTQPSPEEAPKDSSAHLREEFPEPKNILYQVLNEAFLKDQSLDLKPVISTEPVLDVVKNEQLWKAKLQMKWPKSFEVEGFAKRKSDAVNLSFLQACQELKQLGVLGNANKPALPTRKYSDNDINSAKGHLLNIYQKIWHKSGNKEFIPKFNTVLLQGLSGYYWQTELLINYPEKQVFKAVSFRSSNAEGIAAFEALSWLKSQGVIDKKKRFLTYTKDEEEKLKQFHHAPYSVRLPEMLQDKMENVLVEIEKLKSLITSNKEVTESEDPVQDESMVEHEKITDLITNNTPYYELTEEELQKRNNALCEKLKSVERKQNSILVDIKKAKSLLPIFQKREEILKLIAENQVVILSGDTGCGKSTQVPQYILDDYIKNMKGAKCNIIVTQPRRVSATALADRVAKERGEKVSDTVGCHIRFSKLLPRGNGAILYCTTGTLLRKMLSNPNLEGISHLIIDEIHERNIQIDFLLILLKNVLETNKNIKLILMSASFNTNLFAHYFNTSAVINIPGKMYPVREYFLEDLKDDIPGIKNLDNKEAVLDIDLVVNVIKHIDANQPPGAVLCFLPGWNDIKIVQSKLLEDKKVSEKYFICPIHSKLPNEEQKNIFLRPPEGQRKIILATNIAETSITIDDVMYVVNSGLHKGTQLDLDVGYASLMTQWITKANVRQRKGRAGRVKPGICYHLFSWKTFLKMDEYPIAEILRTPLESVILDCKLYCQAIKAEEFLSKGLQPPTTASIHNSINELRELRILDEDENLTNLGKLTAVIGAHPRLSLAVIYAVFLECLDPILTICAVLTLEREPFLDTLNDKIDVKKVKSMFDNGLCSDHIAWTKIFDSWNSLNDESDVSEFLEKNKLDHQTLLRIKELREYFATDFYYHDNINCFAKSYLNFANLYGMYKSHTPTILAALTAAFFPNLIKVLQGEINQGKLNKNTLIYSILRGQKAYIQKESVASEEGHLPTPWLTYFSALNSEARRKVLVSSVSSVPGICLLLFAGKEVVMKSVDNSSKSGIVLSIDDNSKLQFSCTEREARLLLDWRECLQEVFQLFVKNMTQNCEEREYMLSVHRRFLPVLKEVLETPQLPFTKGQTYEFVDDELVSKDLPI